MSQRTLTNEVPPTAAQSNIRIGGGELQPHFAQQFIMKESLFDGRVRGPDSSFYRALRIFADFPVNDKNRSNWLSPSDWVSLSFSNVELFTSLSKKSFWLVFIGYILDGEDVIGDVREANRFSILSLALNIRSQTTDRKFHTLLCDYTLAYKDMLPPPDSSRPLSSSPTVITGTAETTADSLDARYYTNPWCLSRVEETLRTMSTLVPLTICLSDSASVKYWCDKLLMRLKGTTYPTAAQALEVQTSVRVLALTKQVSLSNIVKELFRSSDPSSLSNSPLCACVAVTLAKLKKEVPAALNTDILKLDTFLLKLDSILFFIAMYMDGAITVDSLKESKWPNLKKWPSAPMFVRRTVLISLARLSPLTMFGIFKKKGLWKHIFRCMHLERLAVTYSTSNTGGAASAADASTFSAWSQEKVALSLGFENIVLVSKFLHEATYPKNAEQYLKQKYADRVKRPLLRLMKDPLFALPPPSLPAVNSKQQKKNEDKMVDITSENTTLKADLTGLWLDASNDDFQEALAGLTIPCPVAQVPATMLAIGGNNRKQWLKLLEAGQLTPNQVLANIRSLIMLDLDPTLGFDRVLSKTVKASPPSKSENNENDMVDDESEAPFLEELLVVDPVKVLKLKLYLANELMANSLTDLFMSEVSKKKASESDDDEEVKVTIPLRQFRDKDGKITEVKNSLKNCAKTFNEKSVSQYLDLLDSLFVRGVNATLAINNTISSTTKTPLSRAVIVFTSELRNMPRGGLPPKIPDYSLGSLWRNESICLQDLHELSLIKAGGSSYLDPVNRAKTDPPLNKLLFGVTWCQAPNTHGSVDLDIAVMVYDKNWKFLFECSYSNLKDDRGLNHSGDFTSAPYPDGAREAIEVDLKNIQMKVPEAKYLALLCFSYTGQSMDTLYDASVYVADPERVGSGPGKTCVLSAARLTGKGKCNLAAFVTLEENQRQTLTCVDSTLNVNNSASTTSQDLVANCLKRLTTAAAEQEQRLNIAQVAAMQAIASGVDEVVILHGGKASEQEKATNGCVMSVIKREEVASSSAPVEKDGSFDKAFFELARQEILSMNPCERVDWELLSSVKNKDKSLSKTCVFTGELISYRTVVASCAPLWLPYALNQAQVNPSSNMPSIAVVNVRSDDNESVTRMLKQSGQSYPVLCLSGVNMLKDIHSWAIIE